MFASEIVFSLVTLSLGVHVHSISHSEMLYSSAIPWEPCVGATQFGCGFFPVPLDYAHPEVGNATLAVARLNATKAPKLGTIFANPGGPGGSGVEFLINSGGHDLSTITGGQYDIISWDPRGVGQTTPLISCGFTTLESLEQFFGDTLPVAGIEARGNFTDPDDLESFFAKAEKNDAKLSQAGQQCLETDGAFLKYMGTAAVVRDMVSLSDCIEGPHKPVNYYGISYGTVIGNYFVNMFPQRVGRVVIDGIVDTIAWSTEPSYKDFDTILGAADSVFAGFAEKCAEAGPQNCSIAQKDSTPASVAQGVRDLINTAYDLHKAGKSNISSFEIRNTMRSQLYSPTTWTAELAPQLRAWVTMLANAESGNTWIGTGISSRSHDQIFQSRQNTNASGSAVDPNVQEMISDVVITCVDSIDQENVQTKRVFEEVVRVTHDFSPMFGEVVVSTGRLFCHRFPVRAVERFQGPFNHKLANPIIVIGNKADPTTPLANAQRIAETLGDSARLLVQDGFGHSSFAENSDCTQGVVRDYFLHGLARYGLFLSPLLLQLPSKGQVCQTDQALFPPNNTLISPANSSDASRII